MFLCVSLYSRCRSGFNLVRLGTLIKLSSSNRFLYLYTLVYAARVLPSDNLSVRDVTSWQLAYRIGICSKWLQTPDNLKNVRRLIKFIWRCSICAPLVNLYTSTRYSNTSHVRRNCEPSTLATPCEIPSRRNCGIEGCHTWSITYPHRYNLHVVKVRRSRGPNNGSCSLCCTFCISDAIFLW
jgi:hypothetical protein